MSPFKVVAIVVNVLIAVYLLYAKRLFGVRGGAAADEAERACDVGWEALERTAPAHGCRSSASRRRMNSCSTSPGASSSARS